MGELIRYFSLKSERGPREQVGIALRAFEKTLEDMTEMLALIEGVNKENHRDYKANINVNMFGEKREKEEVIRLRVHTDSNVEIIKQTRYPMYLTEITEREAIDVAKKMSILRQHRPRVIAIGAANPELGLEPTIKEY